MLSKQIDQPATLIDLLRHRAEHQPDAVGYRFLAFASDKAPEAIEVTYSQLWVRAQSVAAMLGHSRNPGDTAIITCQPGPRFLDTFFGGGLADCCIPFDFTGFAGVRGAELDSLIRDLYPAALISDGVVAPAPIRTFAPIRALKIGEGDRMPHCGLAQEDVVEELLDRRPVPVQRRPPDSAAFGR